MRKVGSQAGGRLLGIGLPAFRASVRWSLPSVSGFSDPSHTFTLIPIVQQALVIDFDLSNAFDTRETNRAVYLLEIRPHLFCCDCLISRALGASFWRLVASSLVLLLTQPFITSR